MLIYTYLHYCLRVKRACNVDNGKMMRVKMHKILLPITIVSALSGMLVSIFYMMFYAHGEAYLQVLMKSLALTCFFGWLLGLLLIRTPSLLAHLTNLVSKLTSAFTQSPESSHEWTLIGMRREMIERRLQVDEPRMCSARGIVCTCWTYCGEQNRRHSQIDTLAQGYLVSWAHKKYENEARLMPVIDGKNRADCSFN